MEASGWQAVRNKVPEIKISMVLKCPEVLELHERKVHLLIRGLGAGFQPVSPMALAASGSPYAPQKSNQISYCIGTYHQKKVHSTTLGPSILFRGEPYILFSALLREM